MAGHSVPIDFWVDAYIISNDGYKALLVKKLTKLVEPFSGPLTLVSDIKLPGGHAMMIYASENMTFNVKLHTNGLVTSTLEYLVTDETVNDHKVANDAGRQLEKDINAQLSAIRSKVLPAIKRAPRINPYFTSSDDRLLEYDVDDILFEEHTNFQKVQIFHSKSFGNILVLDDLQNLAESDLPYTRGLMNYGHENYEGKEILILGGGDGALLWELLKENPSFVTMIDIDGAVMRGCKKYLRSACGNCLDNYDGKNYKIIEDDAIKYLKEYISEGRKFDYVFADLTDVPISKSPRGELWDFMRLIINLGTKVTKPQTGKYMTHATGIQSQTALRMFEEQFKNLETPVSFTMTSHNVPSFCEIWCFYQVQLVS